MIIAGILLLLITGLAFALLKGAYYPQILQAEPVVKRANSPLLSRQQEIKVLSYNVQFMAGKGYVFWFDLPNADGPDNQPSAASTHKTIQELARIINDEQPDFVLLQEVDDGAKRTQYQDQLAQLLSLLPDEYSHHASAFYWQSDFVPHPRVWGAAGMKLSTLSKHPISSAQRHQLALTPANIFSKHLGIKRAVLETRIPFREGGEMVLLNTHLEAFSKQSDTLQRQVDQVDSILNQLCAQNSPWLIGGDFNLLPAGQYQHLPERQQKHYRANSELTNLSEKYPCIPSREDLQNPHLWYSYFPNDPEVNKPDRSIDYLFYSPLLSCQAKRIRQQDTLEISDHLPLIASFKLNAYTP
ncbi:hypothetical protein A9Q82_03065 [Cycloclasticus sp. 46_120_T64]|nr:hypothetical protein A9Q82_03065 [Cycloclasticus sp. 46_120_T64]